MSVTRERERVMLRTRASLEPLRVIVNSDLCVDCDHMTLQTRMGSVVDGDSSSISENRLPKCVSHSYQYNTATRYCYKYSFSQ